MGTRSTIRYPLAALALAVLMTRAFAADNAAVTATGLVTDSDGQPVRSSSADCWLSSAAGSGAHTHCAPPNRAVRPTGTKAKVSTSTRPDARSTALTTPFARVNAHPGYLTDSSGEFVRGSEGECWHTSSWTPALATVIGCDGVLARAAPIPAPAASPAPQPPAPEPSSSQAPAVDNAAVPATPSSEETAPVGSGGSDRSGAKIMPPAPPVAPAAPGTPPAALAPVPSTETENADTAHERRHAPTSDKVTLDTDTYFDFDKAILKPAGKRKLDALITRVSQMNLEVAVVTGHTDSTGTTRYNQRLSERRALAVKNYLTRKLPGDRIFTEGKGENQPIASNATRDGRAKNRRVSIEMVGIAVR